MAATPASRTPTARPAAARGAGFAPQLAARAPRSTCTSPMCRSATRADALPAVRIGGRASAGPSGAAPERPAAAARPASAGPARPGPARLPSRRPRAATGPAPAAASSSSSSSPSPSSFSPPSSSSSSSSSSAAAVAAAGSRDYDPPEPSSWELAAQLAADPRSERGVPGRRGAEDPCAHGFSLTAVWMDRVVGVAVDVKYNLVDRSPLTGFFFWPENDAWDQLKGELESKPWIPETERVFLLNRFTQLIDYWNENRNAPAEQVQAAFPDVLVQG